ncbi:Hypothetical predicted protein [Mytilus galloprovincialis]|uniref:Peptidase A2 domain-containing protein n=1 Tax=Mytilus galloprovincialis TaxID=29158 RepID=A0A8B6FHA9_MYTGA|nr:Hypothetical predicted protein [Mytilus galloprovincialis]
MQETVDLDEGEDDIEIRKVGGKRYVTEERLTQLERGMKDSITQSVGEIIQKEMTKVETIDQVSAPKHNKEIVKENNLKDEEKPCQMKEHLVEPKTSVGTVSIKRSFEEDSLDIQDLDLSLEMLFEESKEIQQNTPENTPKEVMGSAETISRIEENVIIDRVTAASIAVPVVINKIVTNTVIDTGAEVTVLSEKLYDQIPESKRPKLRRAARNLEVAEAGKNLTTEGITEVKVNLRSETFKWPVYVAPIEENMLLECDLIDEMKVARSGEKDTNSGLVIYKEAERSEFLSTRDSMVESVMVDDRKPMVASTQDMHEYIENVISYKEETVNVAKETVYVQKKMYMLQKKPEETLNVADEIVNVLGTEENENVSVTEEDQNLFCQEEKMSQLKEHFRKTDLDQTKKELENEKYVSQDTQKDWRKRKKGALENTERERTQDTQKDWKNRRKEQ